MSIRRSVAGLVFVVSAAVLLAAPSCTDEPIDPAVVDVHRAEGCHPLGATEECLFPFPSSFFESRDASTETGVRVALRADLMPKGGEEIDTEPYNRADGFSPVMPILVHFGVDVDVTGMPSMSDPSGSLDPTALVSLVDMETGKRVLHFVEMDQNRRSDYPNRYAFIVRPIEPMEMGHRHAVILRRGIQDTAGKELTPTAAFSALRDGQKTTSEQVEAMREHMDELFAFAEEHDFARDDLLLAFDFQVASKSSLLGPILSMREQSLAAVEAGELGYAVEQIETDPNENIAEIVYGTFEVPTFLDDTDAVVLDGAGRAVRQPTNRSYPFTMLVPKKAVTSGPLPLVVLGHGIFGNGRDFLTEGGDGAAIQQIAQDAGVIIIATDWIGLSSSDLPRIAAEVAPDLNRISIITDQLQQALVNAIVLTKLGLGDLKDDPEVKVADTALVDPTRVHYWGASLGGIEGSSFIALSPDIARAVFGVPGSSWSTMLTRSIVFPPVKAFLELDYPDPLLLTFLTTAAQLRFDYSDPANVTRLLFKEPLPDAPKDRIVVLQEAIGDSQVPNLVTDILVRAMGIKVLSPSIYQPYGVETVTAPTTESCVVQFQMEGWDDPAPPQTNTPPSAENNVHHDMNFLPNAQAQIASLLFGGSVVSVCDGVCDPD
ncbi:MAG: hypothetical protein HOW73_41405 [Polyangiaceae bacterium]|nr:hypothetical protein [Polyangiaceae bacterium]